MNPANFKEETANAMPTSSIDKRISEKRPLRTHSLAASNQLLNMGDAITPRLSNQNAAQHRRGFSCKYNAKNRSFMEHRQGHNAEQHQRLIGTMRRSRAILKQKLAADLAVPRPDQAKRQKIVAIKCRLWVLNGAIEHGFNDRLLDIISD